MQCILNLSLAYLLDRFVDWTDILRLSSPSRLKQRKIIIHGYVMSIIDATERKPLVSMS
jgi:hypothetical protein